MAIKNLYFDKMLAKRSVEKTWNSRNRHTPQTEFWSMYQMNPKVIAKSLQHMLLGQLERNYSPFLILYRKI